MSLKLKPGGTNGVCVCVYRHACVCIVYCVGAECMLCKCVCMYMCAFVCEHVCLMYVHIHYICYTCTDDYVTHIRPYMVNAGNVPRTQVIG